ncbi:But2 domain-containing protein [Caenorhabditis elegans]|uniref:But2 domain-containing protein n=1 Tax=Caenorhabditis elegans TaxID=6239 RepID=Q9N5E9_CAEEL|nr:But2 domain-containing protein [Caenorhabditis elegans]CCD73578.1 But2 domain-containing protein [Caenorhabditis elegans]|eukprot:NP_493790.1 Uncharacterized protein CELE_T02H6.7 [Caenorhabditis elegans]
MHLLLIALALLSTAGAEYVHYPSNGCTRHNVMNGFQLKFEGPQGIFKNDHGVVSISFFCNPPDGLTNDAISNKLVVKPELPFGHWREIQWCPNGTVIIGIQTKSDRGRIDKAGITNFAAKCGRPEVRTGTETWAWENLDTFGGWDKEINCPVGEAMYRFRANIARGRGLFKFTHFSCNKVE